MGVRGSTFVAAAQRTGYVDYAVTKGATYTYSVAAFDAAGNIGPTRSVNVTPSQ